MSSKKKQPNKANVRKNRPTSGSMNVTKSTKSVTAPPRKSSRRNTRKGMFGNTTNLILVSLAVVAVITVVIILVTRQPVYANSMPNTISLEQAYQEYQSGTFMLDVRTQEEWDEYHIPNTMLIPVEELESRLDELPKDQDIIVICRSGNRSQVGRDILLQNGFTAVTSVEVGIKSWSAAGYPVEGTPPQ